MAHGQVLPWCLAFDGVGDEPKLAAILLRILVWAATDASYTRTFLSPLPSSHELAAGGGDNKVQVYDAPKACRDGGEEGVRM